MKKILSAIFAASMLLSLTGCFAEEQPPVTEETLPLPLWAQEEEKRTEAPETTEEPSLTERPALPDDPVTEEETAPTVSQRPEKYPDVPSETDQAIQEETEASGREEAETQPAVTSAYEMEEKFRAISPETVYAVKSVNIRSQGNVNSDNLGRLGEGKAVTRIGVSDDGWSAILYEEEVRYIASEYLSKEEHPEPPENPNVPNEVEVDDMVYTVDDVNMREGPGFDRAILCRVPEFVELHRTGIVTSGWSRVTYKDQEGFISTGYLSEKHPGESEEALSEEEADDEVYTTREVNFRSGPGTKKSIICRIPQGTKLHRIGIAENGWAKVVYKDQTGYVSGDYVSVEPPAEG